MPADQNQLDRLLELIEEHINLEDCWQVDERYRRAFSYEQVDWPPLVAQPVFGRRWLLPRPWDQFEFYPYRQAFYDPRAMLQNQLLDRVVPGLILKDDSPLAIRNDHGTIQIASLLGASWYMHGNDYPWMESLGSTEAVRSLIESDQNIDWEKGLIGPSTRTLKFYREQLSRYPRCQQALQISLPDLQGPMDTAEMLWGSEMFVALLDEPSLAGKLMDKVVCAMLAVAEYYRQFTYDRLEPFANTQHGYFIPGRLLIRNDSSILVSPETYRQVIAAQDSKVLRAVGTGSIHFCGNGEHLVEPMLEIPGLRGLDFGQANMMDVRKIYEMASHRKVVLTCLKPSREDLISGQAKADFSTGVVFVYNTETIADACEVVASIKG